MSLQATQNRLICYSGEQGRTGTVGCQRQGWLCAGEWTWGSLGRGLGPLREGPGLFKEL